MDIASSTGIVGAVILLIGAAWPIGNVKKESQSIKNWIFIAGNALMFAYALLNYYLGQGVFFFILLQLLVNVGGWLGVIEWRRGIENAIVGVLGMAMILWSLFLFEGGQTIFFIIGLTLLALGFSMNAGKNKQLLLMLGSGLVAYFSFLVWDPIFLGLNVFFALFSGYYLLQVLKAAKKRL